MRFLLQVTTLLFAVLLKDGQARCEMTVEDFESRVKAVSLADAVLQINSSRADNPSKDLVKHLLKQTKYFIPQMVVRIYFSGTKDLRFVRIYSRYMPQNASPAKHFAAS